MLPRAVTDFRNVVWLMTEAMAVCRTFAEVDGYLGTGSRLLGGKPAFDAGVESGLKAMNSYGLSEHTRFLTNILDFVEFLDTLYDAELMPVRHGVPSLSGSPEAVEVLRAWRARMAAMHALEAPNAA